MEGIIAQTALTLAPKPGPVLRFKMYSTRRGSSRLREELLNPMEVRQSQHRFNVNANKIDFTAGWSLCLVVPRKENGDIADKAGEYVGKLQNQLGFQCLVYQGLRESELFVLLRIPPDQISKFAHGLKFPMLLDENKLEEFAKAGNPTRNINGFAIPHKPDIASYRPCQHIYTAYDEVRHE